MCLLVTQQFDSPKISRDWIEDFATFNPDGIGAMYVQDGQLVIKKQLFKSVDELVTFFEDNIDGRDCAFHFRMKTHGNIDLENCHPYQVCSMEEDGLDMWMMHNGILHTGNKADVTKSDTWHYIRDYIRPLIKFNPDVVFEPFFADIIGEHIGSNRFVFMDNTGRIAVVNEDQGVYWGGRWMSNTYAWNAPSGVSKNTEVDMWDLEKAQVDVDTPPVKYVAPKYSAGMNSKYYNNPYAYSNAYAYDNNYDLAEYGETPVGSEIMDVEWEIDESLQDLQTAGFKDAGKFSRRQANAFVERFGLTSFFEFVEMVYNNHIEEDSFIRIMSDFSLAKESFPFLIDAEKDTRLYGVESFL
jgi:hypothetical protein